MYLVIVCVPGFAQACYHNNILPKFMLQEYTVDNICETP